MGRAPVVTRVATDGPDWRALLDAVPHDFAHLPGFLELSAAEVAGEPAALVVEGDGVRLGLPLILRPIPEPGTWAPTGWHDAVSAYGYPSPLLALAPGVAPDDPAVAAVLDALLAALRDLGVVSAFIRLHPLLDLPHDVLGRVGRVALLGPTVTVDLSRTEQELWADTSGFHRHSIERARKLGCEPRMDAGWAHVADFLHAYTATMARVGAGSDYFFSPEYVAGLQDVLGPAGRLAVVERDGEVEAAGLVTEVDGIVQLYLVGTLRSALPHSPAKVLEAYIRSWAKGRGDRWFHLGGGVGMAEDGLFRYKLGFSSLTHPYHTWDVVVDRERYDALVARRARLVGPDEEDDGRYFPLYRRPLPIGS
ncbi:MAG: GNAT family N-acetyltransferase [Chloroflexota bacterium]